jgi:hypothetical protein
MNYKNIVKQNLKYHYFIATTNKLIDLGASNSKKEAKRLALVKLEKDIDKLIGKYLILVKIKSVYNKFIEQSKKENSLNMIKAPIVLDIEYGLIKDNTKIKNLLF